MINFYDIILVLLFDKLSFRFSFSWVSPTVPDLVKNHVTHVEVFKKSNFSGFLRSFEVSSDHGTPITVSYGSCDKVGADNQRLSLFQKMILMNTDD